MWLYVYMNIFMLYVYVGVWGKGDGGREMGGKEMGGEGDEGREMRGGRWGEESIYISTIWCGGQP